MYLLFYIQYFAPSLLVVWLSVFVCVFFDVHCSICLFLFCFSVIIL